MRIAVLGTGPTSVQALYTLALESQNPERLQISVFDFNHAVGNPFKFQQKSLKTNVRNYSLEIPNDLDIAPRNEGEVWGSFVRGGWSNIWGATLYEDSIDNFFKNDLTRHPSALQSFHLGSEEVRRIPKFVSDIIHSNTPYQNSLARQDILQISPLAIRPIHQNSEIGCIQCGLCLAGCPFNHIWNAKDALEKLNLQYKFESVTGFVISLKVSDAIISVNYQTHEKLIDREFDLVICGLGAIQTSALLMRSNIVLSPINLRDSQMLKVPFMRINMKTTGRYEERIALSEAVISSSIKVYDKNADFFAQLYGFSKSLDEFYCEKIPLLKLMPLNLRKIIFSKFGIAMIFLSEEISGQIELHLREKMFFQSAKPASISIYYILKKLKPFFLSNKLRLLTIFCSKSAVGGGFHFGNIFSSNESTFCHKAGAFRQYPNLLIVDASSLSRISSRPVTIQAMRNSERIVRKWIAENNL